MKRFVNFHCHSEYSNVTTPDVVIRNEDRINRAKELGHTVASGVEHGTAGNFFEFYDICKEKNIKPLLGTEAYFVKDRIVNDGRSVKEKDSTNAHLILLAKNENGRKAINKVISESNRSGYYYKPRIDFELVLSLPEDDVWVTTACLGGIWKYSDYEDIIVELHKKFGENFFLEVQYHDTDKQKEVNEKILNLSEKHSIKIVAGMDSHMIYPEDSKKRDIFLASRGISYEDEYGWYLDFPDYNTAVKRFVEQDVLTREQAVQALDETLVFEEVEEYTSHIFNKDKIKLPTIYPDKTQEEKDEILSEIVWSEWEKTKKDVPEEKWEEYKKEIEFELHTIIETGMSDYFLLNFQIIKRGKDLGGRLTLTSRGSAPSYYISKLLGFTTIDRINSRVKLFPERFMSKERILETHSLPDIDFNVGNPEVFEKAQREILGDGKSYRMLTYQRVHESSAWKMYARYVDMPFEESNEVSDMLKAWRKAIQYSGLDDEDEIREQYPAEKYIGKEHIEIYRKSRDFLGLVNSLGSHPCAFLLLDEGDIEEEIGLIRTRGGELCAVVEGKTADKRLFLKNDLLKVTVVDNIYETYQRIGIEPHTVDELIVACENDADVWDLYKRGITLGLNQVETEGTTRKIKEYAPENISELSSFVAAIRPGFKSKYKEYAKRQPFSYDIPAVDNIIQTEEFPFSYMLYQENAMAVLGYAGIPMYETYQIVKDIAKKNHDKVYAYKRKFIPLMTHKLVETEGTTKDRAKEIADDVWQIIEDSARYSFNSSHSYSVANDSLYGAWQKAHYPLEFYETLLRSYEKDAKKDKINLAKTEARKFFDISFPPFKWGQDNRNITMDKSTNSINMSLSTIKGFGNKIAQQLFELHEIFSGDSFLELMVLAVEKRMFSKSKWKKLIRIGYFSEFGSRKKILEFFDEFTGKNNRYNIKLKLETKEKRLEKLVALWDSIPQTEYRIQQLVKMEYDVLGQVNTTFDKDKRFATIESSKSKIGVSRNGRRYHRVDFLLRSVATGNAVPVSTFIPVRKENPFKEGTIVYCQEMEYGKYGWTLNKYHYPVEII